MERIWPPTAAAVAIIALVVATNEGYRKVRVLVDTVAQSKRDVEQLKHDLYVLQTQLDNGPGPAGSSQVRDVPTVFPVIAPAPIHPAPMVALPMPAPMGTALSRPEAIAHPRARASTAEEPKSLVNVLLMSDVKASALEPGSGAKMPEGPKIDVHLIGDSK